MSRLQHHHCNAELLGTALLSPTPAMYATCIATGR